MYLREQLAQGRDRLLSESSGTSHTGSAFSYRRLSLEVKPTALSVQVIIRKQRLHIADYTPPRARLPAGVRCGEGKHGADSAQGPIWRRTRKTEGRLLQ